MRNKKWIAILMAALILVCGNTVAFANGDLNAVYIEDTEADINSGKIPFIDENGYSYNKVKQIMSAQHPYLVAFSEESSEWIADNDYPDYFAGAYFRNNTEFVIKSISLDDAVVSEIKNTFGANTIVESGQYSYEDLLEEQKQLSQEILSKNLAAYSWINMEENAVEVVIAQDSGNKSSVSPEFISKLSDGPFSVEYVNSFQVQPTSYIGNNTGCYYTATGHTSSLGCWFTHAGVNKIFCAGHSPNGVTGQNSKVYTSSSQSTQIGYVSFAQYNSNQTTEGDFAFITVNSSHSPADGNQRVEGFYTSSIIPNSTYVYRSGKSSASSGYVLQTGVSIIYDGDSGYRTNMVKANYSTTVGESGNAIVAGNNLFIGIQGGGTGPSYFTPFSVINNYF